jgi:hypothetical protein
MVLFLVAVAGSFPATWLAADAVPRQRAPERGVLEDPHVKY